jgi:hypothetical protein
MADVLQQAINDSHRVPNMVLTAHVHNYQRIERQIAETSVTPFLVVGNGGYHHLHGLNAEVGTIDDQTNAKLVFGDDHNHGYVTLTVDGKSISGIYTRVSDVDGKVTASAEKFTYPVQALMLSGDTNISL